MVDAPDRLPIKDAITAANQCSLAYGKDPLPANAQMVDMTPFRDVQCLVITDDNRLTFAFRGTADLRAWLSNAAVLQKKVMIGQTFQQVHTGFWDDVWGIWDILSPIAEQAHAHGIPIYTTGHSKGAGECRLFTYYLAGRGIKAAQSITFGEPRSLSKRAALAYTTFGIPTYRVVDDADIVCRLPWPFYRHVGWNCFIDKWGQTEFNEPWYAHIVSDVAAIISEGLRDEDALVYDHGIGLYQDRLKALLQQAIVKVAKGDLSRNYRSF